MITVGAYAQTNVPEKTSNVQQIILQLKQQPTANTRKAVIKKKLDLIKKGLAIDPNNSELLYQQALIFTDIERYQLALNITDKLLQQDSTNTKYLKLQKVIERQLAKIKQTNVKLSEILKQNPQDIQTRLMLIENEIILHNYKKALAITKEGLKLYPNSEDLLYQQMLIYIDMEQYRQAKKSLTKLSKTKSGMEKAQPLTAMVKREAQKMERRKPKHAKPIPLKKRAPSLTIGRSGRVSSLSAVSPEKNFITFESYPTKVKDLNQTWFYNYLTYGHKTNFATYLLGVDHVHRGSQNGFRYRAEMYPKISKNVYFHLAYAYANTTLLARHYGLFRAHFLLPDRVEFILGGRYYRIVNQDLWSCSIWASKFFGKHWFALRPDFYSSSSTNVVAYITGIYRYYFNEPNHYISLSVGGGRTPDLLDLDATGFVIIHAWHAFVSYQAPVTKTFFLMVGGGFAREKFPTGLVRRKVSGLIGFKKLF
jgi:YaiO family outer membrane protein